MKTGKTIRSICRIIVFVVAVGGISLALYQPIAGNKKASSDISMTQNNASYQNGYQLGKLVKMMGDPCDPDGFMQEYRNSTEQAVSFGNEDYFRQGYKDGYAGTPNQHEKLCEFWQFYIQQCVKKSTQGKIESNLCSQN